MNAPTDLRLMIGKFWRKFKNRPCMAHGFLFLQKGRQNMNLVEKLLKIDKGEYAKKKTRKLRSKVLSEVLGEDAVITIESVSPKEILDISAMGVDEDGNQIIEKTLDVNSLIAAAVVVDPPLRDKELMAHLGAATPAMAALKLFKGEVNTIAMEANRMAGFNLGTDVVDDEVKN